MSIANHLVKLQKKHDALQVQIEEMQRSPGSEYLRITELKKQKLLLKEKIEGLKNPKRKRVGVMPEMTLEDLKDNPEPEADTPIVLPEQDQNDIAA